MGAIDCSCSVCDGCNIIRCLLAAVVAAAAAIHIVGSAVLAGTETTDSTAVSGPAAATVDGWRALTALT